MVLGDSKSLTGSWQPSLVTRISATTSYESGAVGGATVASALASIESILDGFSPDGRVTDVLMNWGANEMSGTLPSEATWTANYLAIIDAVHGRYPTARLWLAKPWRQGKDAASATLAGYVDTIVAARSFTYEGHDESVWLKGSDDGATMTSDGIHYTAAGNAEAAKQWETLLNY